MCFYKALRAAYCLQFELLPRVSPSRTSKYPWNCSENSAWIGIKSLSCFYISAVVDTKHKETHFNIDWNIVIGSYGKVKTSLNESIQGLWTMLPFLFNRITVLAELRAHLAASKQLWVIMFGIIRRWAESKQTEEEAILGDFCGVCGCIAALSDKMGFTWFS